MTRRAFAEHEEQAGERQVSLPLADADQSRLSAAVQSGYERGLEEGLRRGGAEMLAWLEGAHRATSALLDQLESHLADARTGMWALRQRNARPVDSGIPVGSPAPAEDPHATLAKIHRAESETSAEDEAVRSVRDAERRPCGCGGLSWVNWAAPFDRRPQPDLSDCLVSRPKPWRLVIWEPLLTKAPSPALVQPYCCYSRTVVFYHRPYVPQLRKSYWRSREDGILRVGKGGFEQWDQIETRLSFDDVVGFEGVTFVVNGGRVRWARRRWWMCREARKPEMRNAA